MNAVDASDHFDKPSHEQSPALLTIILDTNPAAWSLLSSTLPFSSAIANLLVFLNAHLAANYANKVAVIASHCDKATWLYPSPTDQKPPPPSSDRNKRSDLSESAKRLRLSNQNGLTTVDLDIKPDPDSASAEAETGNKYRPFRLVEEELLRNLTRLLSSTTAEAVSRSPTTMIAGALTLALSNINREAIAHAESLIGVATASTAAADPSTAAVSSATEATSNSNSLQSRILLVSVSPSTDLAHQYIPIMNAIFACQRLSIPIDVLQLPLPSLTTQPQQQQPNKPSTNTAAATASSSPSPSQPSSSNSTVFLQQAADATHGIFIAAQLPSASASSSSSSSTTTQASQAFLAYLLASLLPPPSTRSAHLILPTRIDVDFRAACFCHRNVVSIGFVCSICLSIFCSVPENGDCLTCGTHLSVGRYGARPVVVARKSKKKHHTASGGKATGQNHTA
ncbi:hypothetical protein A1O3_05050 [Capronia epimyces CBS 606.96]|uniref:General transcription and DNA repair factor IIH subunit TFB4 n=1 Tax=Capronia epimyces CBS 606.96 TaxID=1182542 RepID=W9XVZ7_9EURO|nr:uncharacterized protein A1O3_05050 [Capronia epimyces CBS 606.96]EXJ84383.1 hypothetical protein A1O3_05050 [Capronia epimyces CBS 606.96]